MSTVWIRKNLEAQVRESSVVRNDNVKDCNISVKDCIKDCNISVKYCNISVKDCNNVLATYKVRST